MSVSSPNTEDLTRTENLVELVQPNLDLTKPYSTLTISKTDQALEVILSKVTDLACSQSDLAQGQSSLESRLTKSQSDLMQLTATILNEMSQRIVFRTK